MRQRPRVRRLPLLGAALLLLVPLTVQTGLAAAADAAAAPVVPGCAQNPDHPGGEWRHFGSTLQNTRNQAAETTIGPENAADLEIAWTWSPSEDGKGIFYNTPLVYAGCVWLSTHSGHVIVRNADTGDLVWQTANALEGNTASLIGGVTTGSPAVSDDFWIYMGVMRTHSPYVAAFKPTATGGWELAWTTTVDETPNSMLVTGPLLYDVPATEAGGQPGQLLFQGIMGAESSSTPRGGYAFLDPKTGAIVAKGYTIDDESYAAGYRGASIWGQSAIDEEDLYVYAPTGNPASKQREHKHANAVVKIDADPRRETFGQIVGSYKGNPDNYVEQVDLYDNPVCQSPLGNVGVVWGQVCLQQDLDFGAAPNMFTDANGRKVVGAFQKSGVYHAFDAESMERIWATPVGTPGIPLNAASPALDGGKVIINAQAPGHLTGVDLASGLPSWIQPMADATSFIPVSAANGVAYAMDTAGVLHMTNADTGELIEARTMTEEFGTFTSAGDSAGIAIARNTVYVQIPDYIIAYRLPTS